MWIAKAVEDFGLATINVQQLIEFTTVSLSTFLLLMCDFLQCVSPYLQLVIFEGSSTMQSYSSLSVLELKSCI